MPHIKKIKETEPISSKSIMTTALVDSGGENVVVGGITEEE